MPENVRVEPDDIKINFGRKEKASSPRAPKKVTRTALVGMVASCNFVVVVSGYKEYALSTDEIETLADALHDVIIQYPTAAKFLIEGGKLSPWLTLGVVTFPMLTKRVALYQELQKRTEQVKAQARPFEVFPDDSATGKDDTGSTRSTNRDDGFRQNGIGEGFYQPSQMGGNY